MAKDLIHRKRGRHTVFSQAEEKLGAYIQTSAMIKQGLSRKQMFKEVHALQKKLSAFGTYGRKKQGTFKSNARLGKAKVIMSGRSCFILLG